MKPKQKPIETAARERAGFGPRTGGVSSVLLLPHGVAESGHASPMNKPRFTIDRQMKSKDERNESTRWKAGQMWLVCSAMLCVTGCGTVYKLPGHAGLKPDKDAGLLPTVTLSVSEEKSVLVHRPAPVGYGFRAGLVSSDPGIVAIVYRPDDATLKAPFLRGVKAGTCRVHYINQFTAYAIVKDDKLAAAEKQQAIQEKYFPREKPTDATQPPIIRSFEVMVVAKPGAAE
jgi:hypothetical protein